MALPKPCDDCAPDGLFVIDETRGGMKRCGCERGRALAALDLMRKQAPTLDAEPKISKEAAAIGTSMLSVIKYFPAEEGARTVIGEEFRRLCHDDSQVVWLASRVAELFAEWPGLPALRAVAWAKFIPLDRKPASAGATEIFPEGVPPELPDARPEYRALPSGSQDVELDAEVTKLASLKRFPENPRQRAVSLVQNRLPIAKRLD